MPATFLCQPPHHNQPGYAGRLFTVGVIIVMRISDFPRPPDDNGRGVHWSSIIYHPSDNPGAHGLAISAPAGAAPRVYREPGSADRPGPTAAAPDPWQLLPDTPSRGELTYWINELQAMKIKWVKLLDDGGGSSEELCRRLLAAGIMPIVRLFKERPNPDGIGGREYNTVSTLVQAGVRYFEANNEPDLPAEWRNNQMPDNWLDIVIDNFIRDADEILRRGGLPALPAMGPGSRDNPIAKVVARGRRDLFERGAWLAIHNYTLNHPLDYPDDPVNQTGTPLTQAEYDRYGAWSWDHRTLALINQLRRERKNPGHTVYDDPNCFRGYEAAGKMMFDSLGFYVPAISTEGGPVVGWGDDLRYNKLVPDQQMAMQLEIVQRMQNNQVPEWYFAMCTWLIAARALGDWNPTWEQMGWYTSAWDERFGLHGQLPIVAALKALPSVSRLAPVGRAVLHGQLRRPNGAAVGVVRLVLTLASGGAYAVSSNAGGAFRFEQLPAGTYELSVVDAGAVASQIVLADGETQALEVALTGTANASSVQGQVLNHDGTPGVGANVDLLAVSGSTPTVVRQLAAGVEGRYGFAALAPGAYQVRTQNTTSPLFELDGWSTATVDLRLPAPASLNYVVVSEQAVAAGARRIFGRVTDAQGTGLNQIKVEMSWANPDPGTDFPTRLTGHDPFKPAGSYEFLASAGEFRVRVVQGDWPSEISSPLDTVTVSGQTGDSFAWQVDFRRVAVRVDQSVVSGRVTNAPPGAVIALSGRALGDDPRRQTLPASGDFRFVELAAGNDYVLTIEGIARIGGPFALDGVNQVTRSMALTGELAGAVNGAAAGTPVTLARVSPLGWERRVNLGADGRYVFGGLPPGRYQVRVADLNSGDIMLAEAQRKEAPPFTLAPAATARITGRVVDANGQAVAHADVFLNLDGEIAAQTTTDDAGNFEFANLPPATYQLFLPDFDLSQPVTLAAGQVQSAVLTVPAPPSPVKVLAQYIVLPRVAGQDIDLQQVLLQVINSTLIAQPQTAVGYSLSEARSAQRVILVGGEDVFSVQDQQQLIAAGCTVERIVGDLYATVAGLGG